MRRVGPVSLVVLVRLWSVSGEVCETNELMCGEDRQLWALTYQQFKIEVGPALWVGLPILDGVDGPRGFGYPHETCIVHLTPKTDTQ